MKKLIRGKDNHSENGMSGRRTYFSLYVLQQICTMWVSYFCSSMPSSLVPLCTYIFFAFCNYILNSLKTEIIPRAPSIGCSYCLVTQSCPTLAIPRTISCQVPPSMRLPRQEFWSGLPFPSPGDLPDPGIKPISSALAGRFFITEPSRKPMQILNIFFLVYRLMDFWKNSRKEIIPLKTKTATQTDRTLWEPSPTWAFRPDPGANGFQRWWIEWGWGFYHHRLPLPRELFHNLETEESQEWQLKCPS